MSDSNIILPNNVRKLFAKTEDQNQNEIFLELTAKGLLKVKQAGASATVMRDGKPLMRVIYLNPEDAKTICDALNEAFSKRNMTNWLAIAETIEMF